MFGIKCDAVDTRERRLIRSQESGVSSRERRSLATDVYKRERKEYAPSNPVQVAQDALYWGTLVLDSALPLITDTGLYYRGREAPEQRNV